MLNYKELSKRFTARLNTFSKAEIEAWLEYDDLRIEASESIFMVVGVLEFKMPPQFGVNVPPGYVTFNICLPSPRVSRGSLFSLN